MVNMTSLVSFKVKHHRPGRKIVSPNLYINEESNYVKCKQKSHYDYGEFF